MQRPWSKRQNVGSLISRLRKVFYATNGKFRGAHEAVPSLRAILAGGDGEFYGFELQIKTHRRWSRVQFSRALLAAAH